MGQLGQFLDPDAGVPQYLDHCPGPEPAVFFEGQVPALAGRRVLGPDPAGCLGLHHCPAQRLAVGGERRSGSGAGRGLQPLSCGGALGVGPGGQGRQDRQPFTGPLIHPGLALGSVFLVGGLAGADGAAHRMRAPAGRVIIGPFGDVEVERPDRGQHAAAVQPGRHRADGPAIGSGRGRGPGHHALLPRGGDVAGSLQRRDAGMVSFQIGPEQLAEQVGEMLQRGEVHRRLTLAQVIDQHVADRLAGDAIAVDQLLARRLPAAGEYPHRRGRAGAERAPGMQQLVEERAAGMPVRPGARPGGDLQQLHAVPDGDRADGPPLAAMMIAILLSAASRPYDPAAPDWHSAASSAKAFGSRTRVISAARFRGADGHRSSQPIPGRITSAPISTSNPRRREAPAEPAWRRPGAACPPGRYQLPPVAAGFSAAGQPPVLPAASGLGFQPVHHGDQAQPPAFLAERIVQRERRRQQLGPAPAAEVARPRHDSRPGREPGQQVRAGAAGRRREAVPGRNGHHTACHRRAGRGH